jgi:hypothetical protein
MIIHVSAQGRVELNEPEDFKNFKIVLAPGVDAAAALAGTATLAADGKIAWVSQDAVRRLRGADAPASWGAAFDKMVNSVRKFGWINDQDRTVRAHIEIAAS